jgi:hypothetical protein
MEERISNEELLKAFAGRRKTITELASEVGESDEDVRAVVAGMVEEGVLSQEAEFYWVTDEHGSHRALTDLEWKVVNFLLNQRGKPANIESMTVEVKRDEVRAAVERLVALGIVVRHKRGGYRITAQSELLIPLTPEEREELRLTEGHIDELVGEVHLRQIEVARELRHIRDGKWYRETHKRFQDYVEERWSRTRDWAYKAIRDLEVAEGLLQGTLAMGKNEDVEALLQTVTAREMPHLARLKREPEKMRQALRQADEKAKAENRERTPDDVKDAVIEVATGKKPDAETPKEPKPKKTRTVKFTGIDHEAGSTDDLPTYLVGFARWLRNHPTDSAFTIDVGEAVAV